MGVVWNVKVLPEPEAAAGARLVTEPPVSTANGKLPESPTNMS